MAALGAFVAARKPLREGGFTLLELLIVVGIIATLLVLMAPAFTYIKGGTDVTSAAYTIKGVLDTARTYAKANNTYTWVGFLRRTDSTSSTNPATAGNGRVVFRLSRQRTERGIHFSRQSRCGHGSDRNEALVGG